jgi:hypothetical protein
VAHDADPKSKDRAGAGGNHGILWAPRSAGRPTDQWAPATLAAASWPPRLHPARIRSSAEPTRTCRARVGRLSAFRLQTPRSRLVGPAPTDEATPAGRGLPVDVGPRAASSLCRGARMGGELLWKTFGVLGRRARHAELPRGRRVSRTVAAGGRLRFAPRSAPGQRPLPTSSIAFWSTQTVHCLSTVACARSPRVFLSSTPVRWIPSGATSARGKSCTTKRRGATDVRPADLARRTRGRSRLSQD